MKTLIKYFAPSTCKDRLEVARDKAFTTIKNSRAETRDLCNDILCLFEKHKDKIVHEVSTPNDYRHSVNAKLQAK